MAGFPARDEEAFMKHWAKILVPMTSVTRTIVLDGRVAGNIGSWEQDGKREVGYWIGREHWGKGVATKALSGLLEDVSTRPLYAHVVRHNLASIRVLEKCGFTRVEDAGSGGEPVEEIVLRLA